MKFRSLITAWIVACVLSVFSCASNPLIKESGKKELQPNISLGELGKTVGLTLFQNRTSIQDDRLVTLVDESMVKKLKEMCPKIVVVRDEKPEFSELRKTQDRRVSGKIDNMTLLKQARKAGLNAVITGAIMEIKGFQEELGYLWFKEMTYFVDVHIYYSVYDTETGAMLLEKYISEAVDLPEDVYRQLQAKNYTSSFTEIQNLLVSLSSQISEEICTKLEKELLKSYVKSISGKQVVITSGSNVSLKSGDLLQIYDSSRVIVGKDEHSFFVSGPKTGVLRIDAVNDDSAQGTIIQGDIKGPDSCLKPLVEQSFFEKLFERF